MRFSTPTTLFVVAAAAGLAEIAAAAYEVLDDYSGDRFFDLFTFDTENDPTNGYVNYLDATSAQAANLTGVDDNGVVTIRSDSSNVASGRGRDSVRVTSTNQYTHALVVLDLQHMPGNACGVWPAFWMTGPDWPTNGEIDIIEGVNFQATNAMTLHTSPNCSMLNEDCDYGCGVEAGGPLAFGDGFNDNGGGVYALEWTSDAISVWFFPRGDVPADALTDAPQPAGWGNPTAAFVGGEGCVVDEFFEGNFIVFDTTFCGDWAGGVWGQTSQCSALAADCQDYVQNTPEAFTEAYWTVNSLKVYTEAEAVKRDVVPLPSAELSHSPLPTMSVGTKAVAVDTATGASVLADSHVVKSGSSPTTSSTGEHASRKSGSKARLRGVYV